MRRPIGSFVASALLAFFPFGAAADESKECIALKQLSHQSMEATAPDAVSDLSRALSAERCGTALTQSGGRELHCRWSFKYRATEAKATQVRLASSIQTCLNATKVAPEQGVNHPDTYDQQRFLIGKAELSLSLKDKAALQRTYVFLRTTALSR
ncbi:MAG: hypothetical protein AAF479_14550 [Pseudomonadota bacterium]